MTNLTIIVPMLPPSVNHMYRPNGKGGKILTDEAKTFRELVCYEARSTANAQGWKVPLAPLSLTILLTYGDDRRNDLDNRVKAAQDALSLALGFDDRRIDALTIRRVGVEKCRPLCEMILEAQP